MLWCVRECNVVGVLFFNGDKICDILCGRAKCSWREENEGGEEANVAEEAKLQANGRRTEREEGMVICWLIACTVPRMRPSGPILRLKNWLDHLLPGFPTIYVCVPKKPCTLVSERHKNENIYDMIYLLTAVGLTPSGYTSLHFTTLVDTSLLPI